MDKGKKVIVKKPTDAEISKCKDWPIWEKEPSKFDWSYDSQEDCLILEGEAKVIGKDPNKGEWAFKAGDYVIFPPGLKCTWIITKAIKKHYNFA